MQDTLLKNYLSILEDKGVDENPSFYAVLEAFVKFNGYVGMSYIQKRIIAIHPDISRGKIISSMRYLYKIGIIERKRLEESCQLAYKLKPIALINTDAEYVNVHLVNLNVY